MLDKFACYLDSAVRSVDLAGNIIRMARYQESDAMDNLPENLQESERYEKMEDSVDKLDDAESYLSDAKSCIMGVAEKFKHREEK